MYEGRQRKAPAVRVDGRRVSRVPRKYQRNLSRNNADRAFLPSPYDFLRELSSTIHLAADNAGQEVLSAEEILRIINHRINKSLEALAAHNITSEKLTQEKVATTVQSELTPTETTPTSVVPVEGYEGYEQCGVEECSDADMEAGRLSLLRRLGRFPPCTPAGEPVYDLARGGGSHSTSTSISSSSSSGFSDLTPSPPSSAALRPFGPVFLHENPTTVPTRMRNSMIYESLQTSLPVGYEKIGAPERRITLDAQWTICEKKNTTSGALEEKHISVFPKPDFTLDGHQAEILLRRLQAGKRQRCWCRLLTTALGLIFFLFSVMAVSMMLTNGKRMFGSL